MFARIHVTMHAQSQLVPSMYICDYMMSDTKHTHIYTHIHWQAKAAQKLSSGQERPGWVSAGWNRAICGRWTLRGSHPLCRWHVSWSHHICMYHMNVMQTCWGMYSVGWNRATCGRWTLRGSHHLCRYGDHYFYRAYMYVYMFMHHKYYLTCLPRYLYTQYVSALYIKLLVHMWYMSHWFAHEPHADKRREVFALSAGALSHLICLLVL
jgi:hypothetical protein